ncbi:MAG: helix-turn-helix transcriptional regulator [Pyrinomonadaceae bacterium]
MPGKLRQIRERTRLTQGKFAKHVKANEQASVSAYERGEREPPLLVLLAYARLAGVPMENLVDDSFDLYFGAGIPSEAITVIEKPP